jgi:hypothetical protein
MADTFNENAYKFYQDGLQVLKDIKANTDETLKKQDQIISLQEETIKRVNMANIHLESMTELDLELDEVEDLINY